MQPFQIIPFSANDAPEAAPRIFINTDQGVLSRLIAEIMQEIQQPAISFPKLVQQCYELVSRLPLPISVLTHSFVIRARPNQNGEIFREIQNLSYNKTRPHLIPLGRFNLKEDGVFYGSIPVDDSKADGVLTAICEAKKELFDDGNPTDLYYFTVSKWNIVKPINAVLLTQYEVANRKSETANWINNLYSGFLQKACNLQDNAKCQDFYNFISEKAGRKIDNEAGYLLTTAFFHGLRLFYGDEVAIIYSSSVTENSGLNIVLSPQLVDAGCVAFDGCGMYKCQRRPDNRKRYSVVPCSDYWQADKHGCIKITGSIT